MPVLTPNLGLYKPLVADAVDEDLWGGYLNDNFDILDAIIPTSRLPIGSLYFNADDATNPATLLGYGTWVAFAAGRVPIGVGSGTDVNAFVKAFALGDTGGEYQHTQTIPELAAHDHEEQNQQDGGSNPGIAANNDSVNIPRRTGITGSSTPMQWMQPYITVHIWRRTT